MLKFDASKARPFVREEEIAQIRPQLQLAHKMLVQKPARAAIFLAGWNCRAFMTGMNSPAFARPRPISGKMRMFWS